MKISGNRGVAVCFVIMMSFVIHFPIIQSSSIEPAVPTSYEIPSKQAGVPVYLNIPRIHVHAVIESVWLTPEGAMGLPKNFKNTAWLNLGPHPWEGGSAVIDGHFGFINKKPGAFNNLYKLHKGDMLSIQDENGKIILFIVRESRTYLSDENVPEIFSSNDGGVYLNLITCQGVWDKTKKAYPKRLVVFTELVP